MIKEVVVSKEAVEDLEEGRIFYEREATWYWRVFLGQPPLGHGIPVYFCRRSCQTIWFFPHALQEISLRNLLRNRSRHRLYCRHTSYAKRSCMDRGKSSKPKVIHGCVRNHHDGTYNRKPENTRGKTHYPRDTYLCGIHSQLAGFQCVRGRNPRRLSTPEKGRHPGMSSVCRPLLQE